MNKTDLVTAIEREISNALGGDTRGELAVQRGKAWDYFLGEPIGGEREGHSQVVSTDLAEVVDWIMPEVIRAFGSGEASVEFAPTSEEDDQQAENEAKAVNHVFFKENAGILILHDWFQEAFLQKNGYVKVSWDDTAEYTKPEEYEGLTEQEYNGLKLNPDLVIDDTEIIEVEVQDEFGVRAETAYNVVVKQIKSRGRILVESIPANEVLVNSDHRAISLNGARFAGHQREVTQSELIEMGYDRDTVENLPNYDNTDDDTEEISRRHISDERDEDEISDPSQRKVRLVEAYWLVDKNGDGIAERHFVHYAGKEFLQDEEVDRVRIIALTAMPLANKHLGRSFYDKVRQIADIKTAIWRQVIDNLFLQNNSRHAVVEGKVNIRDILNSRAGGIVRMKAPGMIEPLKAPPIGQEAFQFIEYLDRVRSERTGVGPEIVAELGQLANSTAWGVERLMSKKEELVGLIISIFRSTGINELFENIHDLLREHGEPMKIPVEGKWMSINPREWVERTTVPAVTWSGMGDRIEKQKLLGQVMGIQEKLAMSPAAWMIEPKHLYASVADLTRSGGLTNLSQYMHDPESEEGQQAFARFQQQQQNQPPDQTAEVLTKIEQIKGEYQSQIAQLKEQSRQQIEQYKAQMQSMKEGVSMQKHTDEIEYRYRELEQRMIEKMTALEADLMKAGMAQQIPHGLA